jgi:hypothetical protein
MSLNEDKNLVLKILLSSEAKGLLNFAIDGDKTSDISYDF